MAPNWFESVDGLVNDLEQLARRLEPDITELHKYSGELLACLRHLPVGADCERALAMVSTINARINALPKLNGLTALLLGEAPSSVLGRDDKGGAQ